MRNIKRIELFLQELQKLWESVPNLRFGQLFCNLQGWEENDLFYMEDEELLACLKDMIHHFRKK